MSDLASALFSSTGVPAFVASDEWQVLLPGQAVPPGLWTKLDLASGQRMARRMPEPGTGAGDEGSDGSLRSSVDGPSVRTVRDDSFDDRLPVACASVDVNSPNSFFAAYTDAFARVAKFSKHTPVPELGTIETSDAEVQAFYGQEKRTGAGDAHIGTQALSLRNTELLCSRFALPTRFAFHFCSLPRSLADFWSSFISCREFADPEADSSPVPLSSVKQKDYDKRQQSLRHQHLMAVRQMAVAAQAKDPRVARMRRDAEAKSEERIRTEKAILAEKATEEQQRIEAAKAVREGETRVTRQRLQC